MNINYLRILCIILLCNSYAIYIQAQYICNVSSRFNILDNTLEYEYSGLAYYPKENIFFMPLDDPINGAFIRAYDTNNGDEFDVGLEYADELAINFIDPDFEGLTYLEQDYFVLIDETAKKIHFLEYNNDIHNPKFTVLSSNSTDIELFEGDGLEGISYNPHTKTLYTVREMDYRLYSIPLNLPTNNSNWGINLSAMTSVQLPENLFGGSCASGIYNLGKNFIGNNPLSNNILVVSHQLQSVFEFELILDANNGLTNNSINFIKQTPISLEPQAEGIVALNNVIYITSEESDGGLSSYTVNYENESCDDGDPFTSNDTVDEFCNCLGMQEQICPIAVTVPLNANNQTELENEYVSSFFVITETSNNSIPVDVIVKEDDAVNLKGCDITLYGGFVVEAGGTLNATIDPCQ